MPFSDVLASVDSVVSKPGYGILSDCVVNGKPLVYADRENFMEYPILVEAIRRYLRHRHIPAARLYGGDLREALEAVRWSPDPPETCPTGGALVAARHLLAHRR
jgi:L-arabinokinase